MKTLTINNVDFELSDLEIKFLKTLLFQSKNKMKDEPIEKISSDTLFSLLNARKIYSSMFGYQYAEEKNMIPRLLIVFESIIKLKKQSDETL